MSFIESHTYGKVSMENANTFSQIILMTWRNPMEMLKALGFEVYIRVSEI